MSGSTLLHVGPGERGVVRVFALDMPPQQARFQKEPGAAADSLGISSLDSDHVEVIRLSDLDEIGLAGYLTEGCGVPEGDVVAEQSKIDTLDGYVMVVFSQAFFETPATLTPASGVTPVAAFGAVRTDWSGEPIASESALPDSAPKTSPRAGRAEARRIGARVFSIFWIIVALIVLLVVLL